MIINYIIAEYSVSQDCFHVHDLRSMLKHSMENMVLKGSSDWLPIGVFETEIEAHDYIEVVKAQMIKQKKNWVEDIINKSIE